MAKVGLISKIDTNYLSDTVFLSSKDTVYINSLDPEVVKYYTEILEKTNNQLSLWSNPYGIFIAALGILVAVFTVVAAIIHFKQTKDYKEQVNDTIEGYQTIIENFIAEKDKAITTLIEQRVQELQDLKSKTPATDPESEKSIKDIDEKIDKLEQTRSVLAGKKIVGKYLPHRIIRGYEERSGKLIGFYETICNECNRLYIVPSSKKHKGSLCPYCKSVNLRTGPSMSK